MFVEKLNAFYALYAPEKTGDFVENLADKYPNNMQEVWEKAHKKYAVRLDKERIKSKVDDLKAQQLKRQRDEFQADYSYTSESESEGARARRVKSEPPEAPVEDDQQIPNNEL